jgi:protein tyrosine/serine phosphatase
MSGHRAIELDGVVNFRDFGGAATTDGRRVKCGLLYRSGHHADATDADLDRLADLDFALIVDLRRPPERANGPARRPASSRAMVLEHGGPSDQPLPPHLSFLAEPDASPKRVKEQMTAGYRGYPFDQHYVALYRTYFAWLAETDGPVLINCHAGKDRTGFLAALTSYALGARREDIFADYLATNAHNRADARLGQLMAQFEANHGRPVSEALLRSVMMADAAYLEAAFEAIERSHLEVDAYLQDVIGVTQTIRDRLRVKFTINGSGK